MSLRRNLTAVSVLALVLVALSALSPLHADTPFASNTLLGTDAIDDSSSGGDIRERGGKPTVAAIGQRNYGHIVTSHGIAAAANAYQTSMRVEQYGDARAGLPEGEWIASDDGYIGIPGHDSDALGRERTPYLRRLTTGANPVTGRGVGLLLSGHSFLSLESLGGNVQTAVNARGASIAQAWPTLTATSPTAGDGSGGSVAAYNRRVTTTGAVTVRLYAPTAGTLRAGQGAALDCVLLVREQGGSLVVHRFTGTWIGGQAIAFYTLPADVTATGSTLDVTGHAGRTDVWTLHVTLRKEV